MVERIALCGHAYEAKSARGRTAITCGQCPRTQAARDAFWRGEKEPQLATCGHLVPWHPGRPTRRCPDCKSQPKPRPVASRRFCEVDGCDRPRYCKDMCKRHYNAENRRVNGRTDQRVSVPCTHCGAPVEKYASDAKRQRPFCDYTCRDLHRIENPYRYSGNGRVKGIAEPIPASHPARWYGARVDIAYTPCAACDRLMTHATYTEKRYCSVACRRAVARKRRGPRGYRKHAALVYERDDFTCWICDEPVDLTVKAPHPRSATLDHIIPRSLGGTNDPDNLGTAHFICNCRRGASMTLRDRAA